MRVWGGVGWTAGDHKLQQIGPKEKSAERWTKQSPPHIQEGRGRSRTAEPCGSSVILTHGKVPAGGAGSLESGDNFTDWTPDKGTPSPR